jgi:hypothetical protein
LPDAGTQHNRANKTKDKEAYLEQFLDDFEVLKLEVRLCKDLQLITIKQQSQIALSMETIGRQITGWRNASQGSAASNRRRAE